MRLATWNVQHAHAPADGRVDHARFAGAVAQLDADVVALQEVDRGQPRSHHGDLTAIAARALGAAHHCFVPALVGVPLRWVAPPGAAEVRDSGWVSDPAACVLEAEDPATPAYGVALISRLPVTAWRVLRLPPARVSLPMLLGEPPRPTMVPDEPRVAVAARVSTDRGPVTVVSTHLSFVPGWNLVQLRRVLGALGDTGPLVLMGDLNAGARATRAVGGLDGLVVGPTFPAWSPVAQLDHVLGRGVTGRDARVLELPLSDHRALTVTVD